MKPIINRVKNSFVCLTVIVFVIFSCGHGNKTEESDVVVSQYTKAKDYPAGALEKMKSPGKTVEGEKTVTVNIFSSFFLKIHVN